MSLPQIGTVPKILEAVADSDVLDWDTFFTVSKLLGISRDVESTKNLFEGLISLDPIDETGKTISSDIFTMFVETWRGVSQEHKQRLASVLNLESDEKVLKVLPLVRMANNLTVGTAVLTHSRLFVVRDDVATEITRLEEIISVEKFRFKIILPPGVPAVKLICHQPLKDQKPSTAAQRAAAAAGCGDDVTEIGLLFFSERDAWHSYLMEMAMGHKVALATKDPSAITRAAENIELAEAISKVLACCALTLAHNCPRLLHNLGHRKSANLTERKLKCRHRSVAE